MSESMTSQWVGAPDNEEMKQVQKWLAEGRSFAWMPIFSRANFPHMDPEILFQFDQSPAQQYLPIEKVEDFMQIPPGITGWLLPMGDADTEIVVGVWENEVCFLKAIDNRNGERQSLQRGKTWGPLHAIAELRKAGGDDA